MDVAASDADEPNNENSQVAYSIVAQDPPDDMFSMDPNGTISVKKPTLDREVQLRFLQASHSSHRHPLKWLLSP